MPTYDYVCTNCGHRIEVVHGVHDHGPSACPECGGRLRKVFAPPTVHFKGSGWAKKERSSSSAPKTAKPSGESAAAGSDGSSTSSSSGSTDPASTPATSSTGSAGSAGDGER